MSKFSMVKVRAVGGSLIITIPRPVAEHVNLTLGEYKIILGQDDGRIIVFSPDDIIDIVPKD